MPPLRRRTTAAAAAAAAASASASASSSSTLIYPSGVKKHTDLTPSESILKVARHSRCSAGDGDCVCAGLRPSPDYEVETRSIKDRSADTRDKDCAKQWKKCGVCGHDIKLHGRLDTSAGGQEERIRRIKVAIRLDEMLQDQDKLNDFAYTDEHQESLKKQLAPLYGHDDNDNQDTQPPPPASSSSLSPSPPPPPASPTKSRSSSQSPARIKKRSRSGTLSSEPPTSDQTGPSSKLFNKLGNIDDDDDAGSARASPSKRRRATSPTLAIGTDESPMSTPPASSVPPSPAWSNDQNAKQGEDPTAKEAEGNAPQVNDNEAHKDEEEEAVGQGHGKHPAQSSKGVANQDITPEEAMRQAEEQAEQERREQKEHAKQQAAAPQADLDLVAAGVSVDPVEQQWSEQETAPPKRERPAVVEERTGLIQFRVVSNSELTKTSPQDLIVLTGLKNIFQRQLPKMPREYITRLVLDKNHVSMAIVKRGLQVVGGITIRPFPKRKFAEIVFCAIDSSQQVKGYGQHLMNHLKDHVKESSEVMHFLTYADNYAIGYFKKQGFTKEITLPRSVWVGYIKDYEGGTLMQCSMVPRVKYLQVHEMLAQQKQLVLSKIRSISKSHIVHPGLDIFRTLEDSPDKKYPVDISLPEEELNSTNQEEYLRAIKSTFKINPSDIPGLKESGWTPEMDILSRKPKRGPHHSLMRSILIELNNHQSSWPFLLPVNGDEVPDYYQVIKNPMDLSTMETKLENNQYKTVDELTNDAQLIFDNCRAYNPRNSPYAKCADKLEKFLKDNIAMWKQGAGIL